MKDKQHLFHVKNTPRAKQKLIESLEGTDVGSWLKDQLLAAPVTEEPAPWKSLVLHWEEELLLIASDSSARLRYQALSILLFSTGRIASRVIWDSLDDPDFQVRRLLINRFQPDDRQKFYNRIYRTYLRDSNGKVRKAARERIRKDFSDLFTIHPENLEDREKIHCIELLDHNSSMDHDLAIRFLMDKKPGIALTAAIYLEQEGCLDRLLREASLADMEDLNRKKTLLQAAVESQISSFLDKKENLSSAGSLYLAMKLLESGAGSKISEFIVERVLFLTDPLPRIREVRPAAVRFLLSVKTTESYTLLRRILQQHKGDREIMESVLAHLPSEGTGQIHAQLLEFIRDPDFCCDEALVESFQRLPKSFFLRDMHSLVKDPSLPLIVKKRALRVLCRFGEESTILFILEHLPLLNREEMAELGTTVFQWARKRFVHTATQLFQECDGEVRKALITLEALCGMTDHLDEVEESLTDADPAGRKTALWALVDLDNGASLEKMTPLLYDPDVSVRGEAARALVHWNKEETFMILSEIMKDPHESETVLLSIFEALGISGNIRSISLLVPILELKPALEKPLLQSLLHKQKREEILELLQFFKAGTPALRGSLTKLFSRTGPPVEDYLLEILKEDSLAALHRPVSTILDETGYVNRCIGLLKHRKKRERQQAAEKLILIGTPKAWRGLVMAVKDISREIRVLAIRAMEKLRNNESERILEELKNDPDKRVRKYTLWALEKIEAGKLP